jgi:hypothetical protein
MASDWIRRWESVCNKMYGPPGKVRDAEKKIARLTWAVSNGHLARDCRIVSSPVPPSRRMIN